MLALLHHAAGAPDPVVQAQARRLFGRATPSIEVPESQQTPGGPLSHRELQVLRLLDSERTGPEIARELYVPVNTLRTHTKCIFTKLDVSTRASAVRRAHERGSSDRPSVSHHQSHHVVTRDHPAASYVAGIPAATAAAISGTCWPASPTDMGQLTDHPVLRHINQRQRSAEPKRGGRPAAPRSP